MTPGIPDPLPAVARLRRASRALLTSHRNPDGDAVGSELALAELATALGVTTVIVNRDPAPANLDRLPGVATVRVAETLPDDFPDGYDLVVTVECPDLDRAGFEGLDRVPILNIDHHLANPAYGEVNYLDEEAPAVGEMVWRMFRAAGVAPSPAAATNAYVAVATDTGDFRYDNARPRAFLAAAEMVAAGADPPTVSEWVHDGRTEASVRLLGEALKTLRFGCGGRLASLEVDPAAFVRAGADSSDTDEIINIPRAVSGVEVVLFCKQWEPGKVKVSLRSRGAVDVRSVAADFGGGGHTNAAGCSLEGDLGEARRALEASLARLLGCEP
ncbi:MAG TPA: bifunctional oligoribonuclease/PAP phosphatase NrnA [Methylomirabilota bacterium]|nr:bifunctional oligoribonuclease/PAP phosphatase NrnA [Methylomirabilota bacterium]